MSAPSEDDNSIPQIPLLDLPQSTFLLGLSDAEVQNKDEIRSNLMNMAQYYLSLAEKLKWNVDTALVGKLQASIAEKVKDFDAKLEDAKEHLGESEVRDLMEARADYLCLAGEKDRALTAYRETAEKTVGLGGKIDLVFKQIRVGFFFSDLDLVQRNIDKANSLIEQGGDWDRRNRLKVYEGTYFMLVRDFKRSAAKLLDTVATFTSTEMFTYTQFVFYTCVVSILALERGDLYKKVILAPEILSVIDDLPNVRDLLNSLYKCDYSSFLRALVAVTAQLEKDRYLSQHSAYFSREMRIKAYTQFLDSYKSVTVQSMAQAFGISVDMLDQELSRFVAANRVNCLVDKVSGVIETTRPDTRNAQYLETLKQGDVLLTRIQKLSRVINV